MIVTGVSEAELLDIVSKVSNQRYDGNIIVKSSSTLSSRRSTFTLRARSSRLWGARRSHSGRRTVSACWHAHRDVLAAIFYYYPNARVQTWIITYNGREHFEATYVQTGKTNIGSVYSPVKLRDTCDCDKIKSR